MKGPIYLKYVAWEIRQGWRLHHQKKQKQHNKNKSPNIATKKSQQQTKKKDNNVNNESSQSIPQFVVGMSLESYMVQELKEINKNQHQLIQNYQITMLN